MRSAAGHGDYAPGGHFLVLPVAARAEEARDHAAPDGERHVVDGYGGAVALDQVAASIIALCERDGEVAVVVGDTRPGDGSGREIGGAQAEVFGLEGKTLILDALLPRPSVQ